MKFFKGIILLFLMIPLSFLYPENAIDYYNTGKKEYFNENYTSAIFFLKKAVDTNPNYFEPLLELSKLYNDLELYDYAYTYINKAIKLSPLNNNLSVFSADIETRLNMFDLAEKKYKAVLNQDPLHIAAYNGLAYLYLKMNNKILAKKNLDNVLKTVPDNFDALNMMAHYYENLNDIKTAKKYYLLNIEKNSLNPESYFNFSLFNYKNRKINEAIDNIQIANKIKPSVKYKKYYGKYLLFLNKGDDALTVFREIINKEKDNYLIYYNLAYSYYIISDYDNAIESLKKAINLREDDELLTLFLNYILINKYNVDNEFRKQQANLFYKKAIKAKNESQYDLYIYYLKEAIRLYPKTIDARIELANYFLFLRQPERYIRELKTAAKYIDDKNLADKIAIEQKRITYRLGDDWNVSQYLINQDLFTIPLFINLDIENQHFNYEKIFSELLKNLFAQDMKYEIMLFNDDEYTTPDKIKTAGDNDADFYLDLYLKENQNMLEIKLSLINADNNELIKEYKETNYGNNKVINSASLILKKINNDLLFKAHILKTTKNHALINAGRRSGLKLNDSLIILHNKRYPIEFQRANFIYNSEDVKGYGRIIKLDENISEIKFNDNDFFPDIDVDDIIIYKK